MLNLARRAMVAALVLGSAASTVMALPFYCYCKVTMPMYTAYELAGPGLVYLPDDTPASAREQACMANCQELQAEGCNAFFIVDGSNFCLPSNLAFTYDGEQGTSPSNYATVSRGRCSLYGIDVMQPDSTCTDMEYLPPSTGPSQRARRRQLEQDHLKRHAYAAGIY